LPQYASNTSVSAEKSRAEIERTLSRYGADQFMYGWSGDGAIIAFRMNERNIRFQLPMPDKADFTTTPRGRRRTAIAAEKEWEQATRQRWRALLLTVKAKLEAVEAGIAEFEDEFLAYIMLADGSTVSDLVRPQVAISYETGKMPQLALTAGD
jgi:hypothetical protein